MSVETNPDIGDVVRLDREFDDDADAPSDPATVVVYVLSPSGVTSTPSVVNDAGTGAYHADVVPDEAGTWYYRWSTTGTPTTNRGGSFTVRRRRV